MVCAIVPVAYGRTGNFRSVYSRAKVPRESEFHPWLSLHAKLSALNIRLSISRVDVSRHAAHGRIKVVRRQLNVTIDMIDVAAVCACLANFQFRFLFSCSFKGPRSWI